MALFRVAVLSGAVFRLVARGASAYGNRVADGHVREGARDPVATGGIGCSILPARFGVVPEITMMELS